MKIYGGTTPSTKDPTFWNGQHCFATPKDLSTLNVPVLMNTARRITDLGLTKIRSGLLPFKNLLMSSRAPIGYLAITEVPVAINQGIIAIRCDKTIGPIYALYWLEAHLHAIKAWASGTTFAEISKSSFRTLPFLTSTQEIHAAYESITALLHRQMARTTRQSSTLSTLRDTLLPKLISGELRAGRSTGVVHQGTRDRCHS